MRAERDSMTGMDAHAPALGGEERSDEAPTASTTGRIADGGDLARIARRRRAGVPSAGGWPEQRSTAVKDPLPSASSPARRPPGRWMWPNARGP